MVMFYHYCSGGIRSSSVLVRGVSELFGFGWSGVDLFFVLSGFLITGILYDSKDAPNYYGRFFSRRARRIF
jgi:peptidoglycan/LPS O-acetylase OafA/YrhL